ncbi:hypothetical protein ABH908_000064 [Pseudomonas frederiksbergensis]|uniref:hypothetical protein n=1 Tax=Pseudomonas TaxID=286 RepID=UPI003D1FF3EF
MAANQVQTTYSTAPEPLDTRQREMLAIRTAGAQFEALKCTDKSYSAAGITFVQDGRFTKAKWDGMTVASLVGRFNKDALLATIRSNIADHAHWVGVDIIPVLKAKLALPHGHAFRLDMDPQLTHIRNRGTNKVSGYVGGQPSADKQGLQLHAEFQICLQYCKAQLTVAGGDRLNPGANLLIDGEETVTAETYPELGEKIAQVFNLAISRATAPGSMQ